MNKVRDLLFCLIWMGIFVGMQFIVSFVLVIIKVVQGVSATNTDLTAYVKQIETKLSTDTSFTLMVLSINAILCLIIFGIWFYHAYGKNNEKAIEYKKVFTVMNVGWTIVLALAVQIFFSAALLLINFLDSTVLSDYANMLNNVTSSGFIYQLYIVILGPILEEVLFRGLIFNRLRHSFTIWTAVLLQAVIFGLYHGNLVQTMYAFLLGIIFALVYVKSKTILLPMLLHILVNAFSYLIDCVMTVDSSLILCLVAFIVSGVAMFYMFWKQQLFSVPSQDSREGAYD